ETPEVRIWVANTDCAKIIGRNGRQMRDIEAKSRTKLKVQREDEMDSDSKERYIDIIGTRVEQKKALEAIVELASFVREDEGEVLKDQRAADEGDGRGGPPRIVEVPVDDVGKVLGRKG
ncbi:unnamed protein product, partial [Prorocentrum cordatum]